MYSKEQLSNPCCTSLGSSSLLQRAAVINSWQSLVVSWQARSSTQPSLPVTRPQGPAVRRGEAAELPLPCSPAQCEVCALRPSLLCCLHWRTWSWFDKDLHATFFSSGSENL